MLPAGAGLVQAVGKPRSGSGQAAGLRLQQMVQQEIAGQFETKPYIGAVRSRVAPQKRGQNKQFIVIRPARLSRYGAAGSRRDIGEVVAPPGHGAAAEVQAEA